MATVVSIINMKGGVGKTTLALQLSLIAGPAGRRVLAIDLDPQANLSQSLLGAHRYGQLLRENKPTITQIFEDYNPPSRAAPEPRRVNVDDVIIRLKTPWSLDLIPSRLELSRVLKNPRGKQRRLAKALARVSSRYDLVLIDCAPTESILTDAAYCASRFVLVPVKPEFLGAIGLPLLASSMDDFRHENPDHEIEICGIAFNFSPTGKKLGPEARRSIAEVTEMAHMHGWPIYPTQIPFSRSYPRAARDGTPINTTKNVKRPVPQKFLAFVHDFFRSIGMAE